MRRVSSAAHRAVFRAALVAFGLVLHARVAHAIPKQPITYSIENVDAFPEQVFVAWPRTCGSTGDPLGAVSLDLNPEWAKRQHEVDYEVLGKGVHAISPYCISTMRIYALRAAAFPRATRVATADDAALGARPGQRLTILPALDAIELSRRVGFFTRDPRAERFPFRFDAHLESAVDAGATAHYDLVFDHDEAGRLFLRLVHDLSDEGDASADASPSASASASASASPSASASASASSEPVGTTAIDPTPAPSPDRGTRWVYAAAIGGLLAGGIIAYYQKKKRPPE